VLNGVASLPTSRVVTASFWRSNRAKPVDVDRPDLAVAVHHRAQLLAQIARRRIAPQRIGGAQHQLGALAQVLP
jgi:hypothetical protein